MKDLQTYLPDPNFNTKRLATLQTTEDIAKAVLIAERDSRIYKPILKDYFSTPGENKLQDLKRAFEYVMNRIIYRAETDPQTVKTIPRIIRDGFGDCKHFATLMCSIANSLGFEYFFRLCSYNQFLKQPTHIYCCIVYKGKIIPVDPVYRKFGDEKAYFYKYDYKPLK
jgi:transglutaminase-like putative cysteine protease